MANAGDRVALVTGSSRGIGRAVALELAGCGFTVAVNYFQQESAARATVEEILRQGGAADAYRADVSNREEVQAMVEAVRQQLGPIEALVNNAGITRDRTLAKMPGEWWDKVIAVDLTGVFNVTQAATPMMLERRRGRIVSISSVVATAGAFGQTNYAAAKAGILGFTRAAALELARHGITVNAVCPGYCRTDMLVPVPDQVKETILQRIPLGRFAEPADVARLVRFLVTEGDYITGQCIGVNGGLHL